MRRKVEVLETTNPRKLANFVDEDKVLQLVMKFGKIESTNKFRATPEKAKK